MIGPWKRVRELEERNRGLEERNRELEERNRELERRNEELSRQIERQQEQIEELRRKLSELGRSQKRQAGPYARRARKATRRKPGRPTGHAGAYRQVPQQVDQTVTEKLSGCPHCGGPVSDVEDHEQFVVDLPEVKPTVTRVQTQSGYCRRCKRRVRSRHGAQVSTAGGAAKVSLGPHALGLACELKHRQGMPYRDIAELFGRYFGLSVTHGALVHASVRVAQRGRASYAALCELVRTSAVVHTDDTGWRIDGESAWLWVFATAELTVYGVSRSRGSDVVRTMLGQDFAGKLVSDGLPALDALTEYERSQCLGHLLRRASELCAEQKAGAVRFPLAVKNLLQDVFTLHKQRQQLSPLAFARRRSGLERRLDVLLMGHSTVADNQRLREHMAAHREQLLVCLHDPEVAPTNNLAEQQLRGAVIIRKIGGCNRTEAHAHAHAVLASVAQTAHRHGLTLTDFVLTWMQPRDGPWDEIDHCLVPLRGRIRLAAR